MKKRLFLLLTIALLMFGTQGVFATELNTGLAEPEVIDLPNSEIPKVIDRETATQSDQTESEWAKYTNYYYYNLLDDSKKAAWDDLEAICQTYVSGSKDVPNSYTDTNTGAVMGYTEMVTLSVPLSATEMKEFWCMFMYANPQYYFLKNTYLRSGVSGDTYSKLALVVYNDFCDGADRAVATAQVKQQLATWQTTIDACATDEAKLQKIQDIICDKVTYYHDAADGNVDENISFSQSPYSVICLDKTVCAGYADTFSMLCNSSGIDAISVTSSGHQWNKVRVNDSWYNFDLTWDDTYTESWEQPVYLYYGRSDAMYDCDLGYETASNIASHQEEAYWEPYLPICSLDSNPVSPYSTPGSFTGGAVQVEAPQIGVSYSAEEITVSLTSATTGASIYYTTDGTKPSVADTKTLIYSDSFPVEPDTQVKAIAVLDTYADSEVASKLVQLEAYPITYNLDGGVNHEDNPATYNIKDSFTLQAPSKVGYKFNGWFSDEDCLQQVTGISAGNTGERAFYASWSPITYSIAYDGNGATAGTMAAQSGCKYDTAYTLAAGNYERTGYNFTGWNTIEDGSGMAYEDVSSVMNLTVVDEAVVTLYAQWSPITYEIAFDGNGATDGSMTEQSGCKYDVSYTLATNNFKKTGYTFTGWNTQADGNGIDYADGASVLNLTSEADDTVTLYAQWKVNKYSIAYNGNGATGGSMSAQSGCEYDTSYTLVANNFKKTGYTFTGWNTQADGNGLAYRAEASVKNLTDSDGVTITLYAQWSPITYHIAFEGNNKTSGSMSLINGCEYNTSYTLPANNFERIGYKFTGWNTEADGSGTMYADKASVKNLSTTDNTTATLYAQWTPISYGIAFDGNGATSGNMSVQSGCKYDTKYSLSANNFKKTGYTFTGWNTEADGRGTPYADKATVENLTEKDGESITFYAQWRVNTYTISFEGNGATSGEMTSLAPCEYAKTYLLTQNAFEKIGYTFAGWNTKADGNGTAYTDKASVKNLSATDEETVVLYAQWAPITYTIVFDGNGAESGNVADMTDCEYDATYSLSANGYTKKWYAFIGWNTQADGSGTWYADEETIKNLTDSDGATVTLYAQWMMTTYHIAFDGNGATTGSMDEVTDCKYDMAYELSANNFARTGYKFAGWNTEADGTGTAYEDGASVQNLTNEDNATVTLYAQWNPIVYSIIFDGNGATSGTTAAQSGCKYDAAYALTANSYKKTGYTFAGWNTKADGTGKGYADKSSVKNLTATDGEKITLYAQWTANAYTIKYSGNSATSGSMSAQTLLLYGKSYTLSANKFKRTGYKFTGWNTQKNGKGTAYKNQSSVQNLASVNGAVITLYAQWKANTYNVKFNGNGATSGSMKKLTKCSYGKQYKLNANKFKKTGYKFVGWNTKKNGKGKMYKNKAKIKNLTPKNGKTVTLYAQWKKIK